MEEFPRACSWQWRCPNDRHSGSTVSCSREKNANVLLEATSWWFLASWAQTIWKQNPFIAERASVRPGDLTTLVIRASEGALNQGKVHKSQTQDKVTLYVWYNIANMSEISLALGPKFPGFASKSLASSHPRTQSWTCVRSEGLWLTDRILLIQNVPVPRKPKIF